MTHKKTLAKVYRKAAEYMDLDRSTYLDFEGWFGLGKTVCCCDAILHACEFYKVSRWPVYDDFRELFRPNHALSNDFWWADPRKTDKDQNTRVFALLLAAEIAERS